MKNIYNYYDIDLQKLVLRLTQNNDLEIDISKLNKNIEIGFKILITKLMLCDKKTIQLSNDYFSLIFGKRTTKSIKKDFQTKTNPYNSNSSTYNQFIIDMDSSASKLFRLLLHRVKTGYSYSVAINQVSEYKINLPKHVELELHKSKITFKSFIENNQFEKPIKFKSMVELNKQHIKKYFIHKLEFYNRPLEILKSEDYFQNRSDDSIVSEQKDFYKVRFAFNDYLKGRSDYYKINYTQADSGRYYTMLGSLNKNIRNQILLGSGFTEYDLDLSAPSFLYQVYTQIKNFGDDNLDTIKYYIDNKVSFRQKVASIIAGTNSYNDEDLSDAKQILTSLFFGSRAIKPKSYIQNGDTRRGAIINILKTTQKQQNFFDNHFIEKFTIEVKIMMKVIAKHLRDNFYDNDTKTLSVNNKSFEFKRKRKFNTRKDKEILDEIATLEKQLNNKDITRYNKNKILKELDDIIYFKQWSANSALAFFYQSWESAFLEEEIEVVKKIQNSGNKNMFLLHDAIYLKEAIDKNLFINLEQTSNFKVNVKL